ncbi:MAG TPA: flagellar hook-basal body complex protein FliE [Solirubrobacteraceae bacterium]|jgi:flagellar hook-basal body complex protein FliE|nr:flagellar hook-basal body complex protein FliE [Solirubrobacteraceae bacterium]
MIPAISGAIGPLGSSEWHVGSVGGLGASASTGAGATGASSGSFGGALSSAMNSLEATQANATNAAQGLATGQISDPTQAVTAVENASLSMELASQIRDKLVTGVNTIFQTQV